ncbi:MAG: SDR family oxidoreductase [Anaerolineales bacterium]|nr:SDR family oxidoreductase [Anaerolineales bacterium]
MYNESMNEFKGKVVLITGAGRGAGRAIAEAFLARGALVAVNDITPLNLDELVAQSQLRNQSSKDFIGDISKKVAVQALVNEVLETWGQIDILVNSAAVEPAAPLLDMDEWDWHRTLDVNLTGAFLTVQSVGRVMRQQEGGVIINLIPVAGRIGQQDRSAYVASKFGLVGLTRQAALELGDYGIRVHAVCTGLSELATGPDLSMDVVAAVMSLCRPESDHLNGQVVNII